MGYSVFPAPAAGSKTMYRTMLTSGTSYTVPAGVTYLNVTTVGGGGGSGGINTAGNGSGGQTFPTAGGNGGNTTFTGATTATGGTGTEPLSGYPYGNGAYVSSAIAGLSNTGKGAKMGMVSTNVSGQFVAGAHDAMDGAIMYSTLSCTPGASITYSIGAGGTAGSVGTAPGAAGAAGGSGYIVIEYWA